MSDLLEAAIALTARGIPVFPTNPRTKRPMVSREEGGHGFKDATTDEQQIREWWTRWPDAQISMPTGKRTGFTVVDIDPRHGGMETLAKWMGNNMLDCNDVKTGGGGLHLYFEYDERFRIASSPEGTETEGIDFRSEGGYVVVPPSGHPSGGVYEGEVKAWSKIPNWLAEPLLARERSKVNTKLDGEPIREGGRNDTLFRIGCSLRTQKWDDDLIMSHLRAMNQKRCVPPLDDAEMDSIIKQACSYPLGTEEERIAETRVAELRKKLPSANAKPIQDEKTAPTDEQMQADAEVAEEGEAKSLATMYLIDFAQVSHEEMDRLERKDVRWAVSTMQRYVVLPALANYLEILMVAIQYQLRAILPPEGLLYLLINGDFSAAKTYLMKIVLRLGQGIDVTGATEALFRRISLAYPQRLLAIDEYDDQIRKNHHLEGPMKVGNVWNAPWTFLVPNGRSWKEVSANVGGPKVLTGAELASPALGSRAIGIKMERRGNIELVHRKLWGAPEITDVSKWLYMQAQAVLREWTIEKVRALCDTPRFLEKVDRLTKDFDIPRGKELVYIETLLGELLGWDIEDVLKRAKDDQFRTTETTEFYIELVNQIIRGNPVAFTTTEGAEWRRNKKRELEILSVKLLEFLNNRLKAVSGPNAVISPQKWTHVAREIGWTKPSNWKKETARGPWRNLQYLVFDRAIKKRLGIISGGSSDSNGSSDSGKTRNAGAGPEERSSPDNRLVEYGKKSRGSTGATSYRTSGAKTSTGAIESGNCVCEGHKPVLRSEGNKYCFQPSCHCDGHGRGSA